MTQTNKDICAEAMDAIDRGDTSYLIHGREPLPPIQTARQEDRRSWGSPLKTSLPHNNANRKKKSKRKQAQASRRNNRR